MPPGAWRAVVRDADDLDIAPLRRLAPTIGGARGLELRACRAGPPGPLQRSRATLLGRGEGELIAAINIVLTALDDYCAPPPERLVADDAPVVVARGTTRAGKR